MSLKIQGNKKRGRDMRNCPKNYTSLFFLLPQPLHFMLAKCKAKQDPQTWWNCTYTEGAAAANTFIHCSSIRNKGLSPGTETWAGISSVSQQTQHLALPREKTLEARFQSLKLCGSHISPCVLPHVLTLEWSSLTSILFPILQWSPRTLFLTAICYYSSERWQQRST